MIILRTLLTIFIKLSDANLIENAIQHTFVDANEDPARVDAELEAIEDGIEEPITHAIWDATDDAIELPFMTPFNTLLIMSFRNMEYATEHGSWDANQGGFRKFSETRLKIY